jgi:hypothetical protein
VLTLFQPSSDSTGPTYPCAPAGAVFATDSASANADYENGITLQRKACAGLIWLLRAHLLSSRMNKAKHCLFNCSGTRTNVPTRARARTLMDVGPGL